LVAAQAVAVLRAHAGRELDLLRASPDLAALVAHRGEELGEQIELAAGREEAVADARGAARRALDVPADDDRDAARRHRLRIRLDRAPAIEAAVEAGGLLRPQRAQRPHRLLRARGALLEGHAHDVELLLEPADAD